MYTYICIQICNKLTHKYIFVPIHFLGEQILYKCNCQKHKARFKPVFLNK